MGPTTCKVVQNAFKDALQYLRVNIAIHHKLQRRKNSCVHKQTSENHLKMHPCKLRFTYITFKALNVCVNYSPFAQDCGTPLALRLSGVFEVRCSKGGWVHWRNRGLTEKNYPPIGHYTRNSSEFLQNRNNELILGKGLSLLLLFQNPRLP